MRARPVRPFHFMWAWSLPLAVGVAAWFSPLAAWAVVASFQIAMALLELHPKLQVSPPATAAASGFRVVLRVHVLLQAGLLALGVMVAMRPDMDIAAIVALGIGVGGVTGAQGITYAHELGHGRSRLDRVLGWLLMGSVLYAHFMVEHYRGHHVRVATAADPATARRGESLWRFLPRTLAGSWRSAWALEAAQLARLHRGWQRSPLAWATLAQGLGLVALALAVGPHALLFWLVQAAYAVFLLETINYIEHYGLRRREVDGRPEPFGVQHAWNADARLTNAYIANLQRHSDHHLHAWKPYQALASLSGPRLPTGYAGCLFLAAVPRWWFRAMDRRLEGLPDAAAAAKG